LMAFSGRVVSIVKVPLSLQAADAVSMALSFTSVVTYNKIH